MSKYERHDEIMIKLEELSKRVDSLHFRLNEIVEIMRANSEYDFTTAGGVPLSSLEPKA